MMNKLSYYIKSMRLRSLPLSLAGVALGIMLAAADYRISFKVALLVMLTTVCLQILSNISNELGDSLSGVDNAKRKGPKYSLEEGGLTVTEMKRFIVVMTVACALSGLLMLQASFGTLFQLEPICLIILGAAAIGGAIKYTLGSNPYGYRGLGDLSVFIFFGLVSVLGAYFVVAHTIPSMILLLPAVAIGCFSVGVLNVNNIRDVKSYAHRCEGSQDLSHRPHRRRMDMSCDIQSAAVPGPLALALLPDASALRGASLFRLDP